MKEKRKPYRSRRQWVINPSEKVIIEKKDKKKCKHKKDWRIQEDGEK